MGCVPCIHFALQAVAFGQQGGVLGGQVDHDGVKPFPELIFAHPGAGQHLLVDEVKKLGGHLQAMYGSA